MKKKHLNAHNIPNLFVWCVFLLFSPLSHAVFDNDNQPNNGITASVEIEYTVVIPQYIYFRIGSATFGDVDKIEFKLDEAPSFLPSSGNNNTFLNNPLNNGTEISATSANNGTLFVRLISNIGTMQISYEVSNTSGLEDSNGNFIPFEQIKTVSDNADFPPPVLSNSGGSAGSGIISTVTGNFFGGLVVNRSANWTYTYLNSLPTPPLAGTYNGTVTYTASAP